MEIYHKNFFGKIRAQNFVANRCTTIPFKFKKTAAKYDGDVKVTKHHFSRLVQAILTGTPQYQPWLSA